MTTLALPAPEVKLASACEGPDRRYPHDGHDAGRVRLAPRPVRRAAGPTGRPTGREGAARRVVARLDLYGCWSTGPQTWRMPRSGPTGPPTPRA